MTTTFDISALTLGDPVVSGRGQKSIPVSYDGRPVVWQPSEQVVLFEPTSFSGEEATRVNLVMRASPEAAAELTQLDEALLNLVVQQSAQIFGKAITLEEAQSRYVPSLKPNEKGYAPTWKCKVNVGGKARVNLWDTGKRRRLTPESWVKAQVWPKAILKSLWIMGKQFGPLFEVGDLMVEEATVECPF